MINKSFEEILASIRERIGGELYMEEGSYTDTLIRAVAMEIADSYFDQQALLPIAFVNETSGAILISVQLNTASCVRQAPGRRRPCALPDKTVRNSPLVRRYRLPADWCS